MGSSVTGSRLFFWLNLESVSLTKSSIGRTDWMRVPIYTHRFFCKKSYCRPLGFLLGLMNSKTVVKVKKERKSIRETCPHFQCGTRQSLVFSWVHQISILTQFCSTFFTVWHKFVPSFLLQASKPLALPGLAMKLQACFPYALLLINFKKLGIHWLQQKG